MKKSLFLCIAMAMLLAGCNSSYKFASSNRENLKRNICYIPTLVNLQVSSTHVSATLTAMEMEGLNDERSKQTVVARALATVNADVMVAPYFYYEKGRDGKVVTLTVIGYPATIKSSRSVTTKDILVEEKMEEKETMVNLGKGKAACNTLTIAEVELDSKKSLTLTSVELIGMNEDKALKTAREKMLLQENADFLYEEQYQAAYSSGLSSFTLTAFPARYVKYRSTTHNEVRDLQASKKPVVTYATMAADVKPVSNRVKLTYKTAFTNRKDAEEYARYNAYGKYNADFILNEQFYYEYDAAGKMITNITICGTPGVYTNFHVQKSSDVLELPWKENTIISTSVFGGMLNIFQKK